MFDRLLFVCYYVVIGAKNLYVIKEPIFLGRASRDACTSRKWAFCLLMLVKHMKEEKKMFVQNNYKCSATVAEEFLLELSTIVSSHNALYIYDETEHIYDVFSREAYERLFKKFTIESGALGLWRGTKIGDVYKYIKATEFKDVEMDSYDNLLCLSNGILDVNTKELKPFSDKFFFTSRIDIEYIPEEDEIEDYLAYLGTTFNNDQEVIMAINDLGGYLLSPQNSAERIFLFDGPGASGKSTLINILKLLFPKKFTTAMSLADLSGNTFKRTQLVYSRVNFASEEKKSYVDAEEIKKIVSGEEVQIDQKFKEPITIIPKTKIILACNGLPRFKDTSGGIARRIIIFKFPNRFKDEDEYKDIENPEQFKVFKKNRKLFNKIKENKSAMLNLFLSHHEDLKKRDFVFNEPSASKVAKQEYRREIDTVREFLEDNYKYSSTESSSIDFVYQDYREWYEANVGGMLKLRSQELGKRIKEVFRVDSCGRGKQSDFEGKRPILYPIIKEYEQSNATVPFDSTGDTA